MSCTCTGSSINQEWPKETSGSLLDPLQTSVRMTYPLLKAYWNTFLAPLHTKSIRQCQEMLLKLKMHMPQLLAQPPCMYIHKKCGKNAVEHQHIVTLTPDHNELLHGVAWRIYILRVPVVGNLILRTWKTGRYGVGKQEIGKYGKYPERCKIERSGCIAFYFLYIYFLVVATCSHSNWMFCNNCIPYGFITLDQGNNVREIWYINLLVGFYA